MFDMELDPPRKREKLHNDTPNSINTIVGDKGTYNTTSGLSFDEEYNTCKQMDVFKISGSEKNDYTGYGDDDYTNKQSDVFKLNSVGDTSTKNDFASYNGGDAMDDDDMLAKALAMSLDQPNDNNTKDIYYCKRIKYVDGKMYPIVLQNENGPCPLLAICM